MSEEKPISKAINEQLPLSENLQAEKIEAKVASDSRPLIEPVSQNVRSADAGQAADSGSATPSQPPTPTSVRVVKEIKVSDDLGVGSEDSGSKTVTPGTADLRIGGSGDSALRAAEVRERPVEVMLRDPLGEVARKERRSLLGISAIAILVGRTGLVPVKIENFGISFSAPERQALLWVFFAVVLYYTAAFIVYAMSDFLSYFYAVHQGSEELKKQREPPTSANLFGAVPAGPTKPPWVATPWPLVGYVTWASVGRGIFDFIIPLIVAGVAMGSLWGAVHQVATTTRQPAAPAAPAPPPAVAPAVPPVIEPTPKTAPVPAKP